LPRRKTQTSPPQAKNNLPQWLRPKLKFLLSKAENRTSFFERIAEIFPPTDERYLLIEKAYNMAKDAFRNVKRDEGVRYFEHLRAVALILIVYLRVRDADLIAATLLHDIVEDIEGWTNERVAREFNPRVALFVYWVTKPKLGGRFKTKDDVDRKYHRMLRDAPREGILIKAPDRLHNLITMWNQDKERMRRKVSETKDFILPLLEKHQILIHEIEDVLKLIESRYGF
jgi:guanosine-3',5'-bis(diphosphate) 3'-pyrophosphohydrolase